jgi:Ca2+-dependent lipid-binding protein
MLIKMEEHLKQNYVNGKLVINAVHGKYLLEEDGVPDPFLRFTFPNKKEIDIKYVEKNRFPVWKQTIECPIKLSRNEAAFIDVAVIDHNTWKNTPLGKFVVDVDPCYANPNTWAFNKAIEVEPPKNRESRFLSKR